MNDTLKTTDNKQVWVEDANQADHWVKSSSQVLARFLLLFPNAKRTSLPNDVLGIGFSHT